MRIWSCLLLIWLAFSGIASAAPSSDPQDATVFISVYVEGKEPGTNEVVRRLITTGTGVLVSAEGTVLTAKHVINHLVGASDKLIFMGSIRSSRDPNAWPMDFKAESDAADVAVLAFPRDIRDEFPFLCILQGGDLALISKGLGFPSGGNFATRPGQVTAQADDRGLVQVNMGLAPGMSGGPILNDRNEVMGIIAGGLEGVSSFDFFTPIDRVTSLLQDHPTAVVDRNCDTAQPPPVISQEVERRYRVDETNDDHDSLTSETRRSYSVMQTAEPGMTIVHAVFEAESETRVSGLTVTISPDGKSVTLTFDLTAGPIIDQYRGWLHGDLVVTMDAEG